MAYIDSQKRKEWFRNRHLLWMNLAKQYHENQCRCCGSINDLQLHHLNPMDKKLNVSRMLHYKWETFLNEVKKCILLCETCHDFQRLVVKHGITRYSKHGCRCFVCRTAWSLNSKRWKSQRRNSTVESRTDNSVITVQLCAPLPTFYGGIARKW